MNTKRITTEITQAADAIRAGQLVAVPTETVYGLAGNGLDPAAVAQISAGRQATVADGARCVSHGALLH